MKNASPRREKNENMPSMCLPSEGKEVKSEFQQHPNQGQAERNLQLGTSEVICCNSELARRFQILRTKTMGHPGHYFHKALSNVTQKSRSQSLPSCLESKKLSCIPTATHKEVIEPKPSSEEKGTDIITVKMNGNAIVSNKLWFRTWPERGNDKFNIPHNNTSNCHGDGEELNKESSSLFPDRSVNDNVNSHDVKPVVSDIIYENSKTSENLSADRNNKLGAHSEKIKHSFSMQPSLSYKSELLTNCDTESYSPSLQQIPSLNSNYSFETNGTSPSKAPIPLTELLQNIPLAYSPVTKQLHIISPNHIQQQSEESENLKKVYMNGLKPHLECIEEEGLVEVCKISDVPGCEDDSLSFESPRSTLQRISTNSLSRTDASSFSSIVSSLSDASPSSINDDLDDITSAIHCNLSESGDFEEIGGTKSKRKGITGFFSRNVFAWKTSRDAQNNNSNSNCGTTPGWKLFGRLSSKTTEQDTETDETSRLPESPASIRSTGSGNKKYEDIVASSSALILHNRPSNLPAKSQDEEQKHRQEYQEMVEAARKKELKEAKLRKKQLQRQLKVEEQLANAARIWNNEILPKWDMMKTSRKARDLWWQGIPPSVRGKVWKLAIGNELNVTHQLYNICLARAQERLKSTDTVEDGEVAADAEDNVDKEASMELIRLDIARTFPHLCIFQRGGPYYDMLHCLLGAYVCYRPDVGYVQGMSFIAAVLILNLEAADAFISFANLLNRPCHMAFFCLNQALMNAYYAAYNDFFQENLPRLYTHFTESSLSADLYLLDWLYTVFAKAMPLDVACRVWDVFLRDGEEFLFKAALGVLHLNQEVLLKMDFIHGAQFLTKLPDDLAADQLFRSIEAIHMNVGKQRFGEVLAHHIDKCEHEPS